MTTTQPLSFTLSDGTPYDITSTKTNPLSNTKPTNGDWNYFLHYYNNPNGKPDVLTCTNNTNNTVYVCAFAPGGVGGSNKITSSVAFGGGGAGGKCLNTADLVFPVTVTLNPIATSNFNPTTSPTTTIQSSTFITTSNPSGVFTLRSGGPGGNGTWTNSAGGKAGQGGLGGGAGGNGGDQGSNYYYIPGLGGLANGSAGDSSGKEFSANNGKGYDGYKQYATNYNVVSTKLIFSDGTTANLASGGMSGYINTSYDVFNGQSGNIAGVMFYYKV